MKKIKFKLTISIVFCAVFLFGQTPIDLNRNDTYSDIITIFNSGQYILNLNLSSDTSWDEENNESAVLSIFINNIYRSDIVIYNGLENHTYQQTLGFLDMGVHDIDLYFDYNKSSQLSSNIHIENIETINVNNTNIDMDAFNYSPILYGRNIFSWNESNHTDIPLIMWYDIEYNGDIKIITYNIIFSNEDSRVGIGLSDMMLSWGRTTDIEWVYEVSILNNEIVSEIFQGASHTPTEFNGEKLDNHPYLINATANCNFSDTGTSDYIFFLPPLNTSIEGHTREYIMDQNPWTYKIMGQELLNENKYEEIQNPKHWELSDVRNYLYLEYEGSTSGSNVECKIKTSFYNDCYPYSNNHNDTEIIASFGNGTQRTAIELPENFNPEDLQYLHFISTGDSGYTVTLNEIKSIFYLSDNYEIIELNLDLGDITTTLNSTYPDQSFILNQGTLNFDCSGTLEGEAICDECWVCSGGNTNINPNEDLDDCEICFGGNQDMDCNDVCFGDSYIDDCNVCDDNIENDNQTCDAGCIDNNAENYDPDATIFNNNCIYNDRTFSVPEEYEKIEDALFFASNQDTVLVGPGIYQEELDFDGKGIILLSTQGPDNTIISANFENDNSDGNPEPGASVITIRDAENVFIDGFTLENGYGKGVDFEYFISVASDENAFNDMIYNHISAGGLSIINSSITLSNLTIKNNVAQNVGGGIGLVDSHSILNNIIIENNEVVDIDGLGGGGIGINGGTTIVNNCIIRGNTVGLNMYQLNGGGAIMCGFNFDNTPLNLHISNTIMHNNTANIGAALGILSGNISIDKSLIYDNIGDFGSAISLGEPLGLVVDEINMTLTNSTIANNHGTLSFGLIDNSNLTIVNSIIWNNGLMELTSLPNNSILNTNIFNSDIRITDGLNLQDSFSSDPLFANYSNNDFYLLDQSPCIDTGTNFLILNDNVLIDMQSDEYSGTMPDMGYFEHIPAILGDINQDQLINIFDIIILVEATLDNQYIYSGDLNQDTQVNILDVIVLVNLILNTE